MSTPLEPSRPPRRQSDEFREVRIADLLSAMSYALDLTEGATPGHTLRTCVIGMRAAEELRISAEERSALFYALLLKDAGCSSNAARMSALFGSDDRVVKTRLKVVDQNDPIGFVRAAVQNTAIGGSLTDRVGHLVGMGVAALQGGQQELYEIRCERGAGIARRMGFSEETAEAIRSLDEHWNGKGNPQRLKGEAIPLLSRIANVAQTVEVFHRAEGLDGVARVLRERAGTWFDPDLAQLVARWVGEPEWWARLAGDEIERWVQSLRPHHKRVVSDVGTIDTVAEAFADIIDAKTPYTYQHSSNVAAYATAIARAMGESPSSVRRIRRAGLLHDVGKLGVSNRILDKRGPLTAEERLAMESHPRYTWEILQRVEAFRDFAWMASIHHEKLDGSGYPFRLRGVEIDEAARMLAVSDIYEALTADRPYRASLPAERAIAILREEAGAKLWTPAVEALAEIVLVERRDPRAE
jgi:putative nucleotidyltransferase with HDIG domain